MFCDRDDGVLSLTNAFKFEFLDALWKTFSGGVLIRDEFDTETNYIAHSYWQSYIVTKII